LNGEIVRAAPNPRFNPIADYQWYVDKNPSPASSLLQISDLITCCIQNLVIAGELINDFF
jgi:hypothetical protein